MKLACDVVNDEIVREISRSFDYSFDGAVETTVKDLPPLPSDFGLGLIVGPSGSGKSTLLNSIGSARVIDWDSTRAVASHFPSAAEAMEKLSAVGLNNISAYVRPYHTLSNGEQHRADMARQLCSGAVIDEFTSVVDRTVARALSVAVRRYVDQSKINGVVLATCHYDVAEWLCPDWIYDAASGQIIVGRSLRPEIKITLRESSAAVWPMFSIHHYLSADINKGSRCWVAEWSGAAVGFVSVIAMPSGTMQCAWRGHRMVILPEFQGLGIGVRMSEAVGEILISEGRRYFGKTAHHRLGEYRERSEKWRATSKNKKNRKDYMRGRVDQKFSSEHKERHAARVCYSHEYVGLAQNAT
jgi:energy-coupling factor transporter ATP-binding protein EcfA2